MDDQAADSADPLVEPPADDGGLYEREPTGIIPLALCALFLVAAGFLMPRFFDGPDSAGPGAAAVAAPAAAPVLPPPTAPATTTTASTAPPAPTTTSTTTTSTAPPAPTSPSAGDIDALVAGDMSALPGWRIAYLGYHPQLLAWADYQARTLYVYIRPGRTATDHAQAIRSQIATVASTLQGRA